MLLFKKHSIPIVLGCILIHFSSVLHSQSVITIDLDVEFQTIEGFGAHGSMNVWWGNGPFYSDDFLDLVIDDLGLTIIRNEFYPDFTTSDSFENDTTGQLSKQLPYYRALKKKADNSGEPLKFLITVWSPPAWMKANNSTTRLNEGDQNNYLLEDHYSDYARHLANFLSLMKNEQNIQIYAVGVQNEPLFSQPFNSCVYTPDQFSDMLNSVGEKFQLEGLDTKIFGPEHMGSYDWEKGFFDALLKNDTLSRYYLGAFAVHSYVDGVAPDYGDALGWRLMYETCQNYGKPLWMTETSGYAPDWQGAFDLARSIYLALKHGKVSAWVWWQLSEPHHGNPADDLYALMYNGQPSRLYYASKHYYRYIRPGAVQIESLSDDPEILVTAFRHGKEGRLTLVLINNATQEKSVELDMENLPSWFWNYRTTETDNCVLADTLYDSTVILPASSITSLVHEGNHLPEIDAIDDIVLLVNPGEQTIPLTGISDGGDSEPQNLTLTAIGSNEEILSGLSIDYQSPDSAGQLRFTPAQDVTGSTLITLAVTDDGSTDDNGFFTRYQTQFEILIIPYINIAPTIDSIPDLIATLDGGEQTFQVTSISDGNDGSQILTFKESRTDYSTLRSLFIDYEQGDSTALLRYRPKNPGSTTVTLTLTDDGGTHLGGNDTRTISFDLEVVESTEIMEISGKEIMLYPNPVSTELNISLKKEYQQLVITDLNGKALYSRSVSSGLQTLRFYLDPDLPDGMYIVSLFGTDSVVRKKFIRLTDNK